MKNILLFIISIFIVQSALAQKVDWNKPLYKVEIDPFELYLTHIIKIKDTIATYSYSGDTMIYEDNFGVKQIYLGGKIIEELDGYTHYIYQYDSLGSLCTKIKPSYTINYTNTYDAQNKLIGIIGTDNKEISIKYKKYKKIEKSRTPKDRYRKVYYYKDLNYQNDTLIITRNWRGNQYIRTEYDSANRPTLIERWSDYGLLTYRGLRYISFKYIDNIKICEDFDIDCIWEYGIIYKKEEE